MTSRFARAVDLIDKVISGLCTALLALVVVLSAGELISRNLFGHSSIELVDVSLQLAILMYFVGYASLLYRDGDIRVHYFYERLPRPARKALDIATALAITGFFAILLAKSIDMYGMGLRQRHQVFNTSNAVVAIPAVLGAALGIIMALKKLLDAIRMKTEPGARAPT